MKKLLLLVLCAGFLHHLNAQIYIEGVELQPSNTGQYIELDPAFRTDGQCTFRVDYGQPTGRNDYITDNQGRRLDFRSVVDGLNIFYANGWEVAEVFSVGAEGNRRYLLKRRF
jgi:hypothetical protein